jgi:hypothetical protein
VPRGTDTGGHPGRKVGRERFAPKQTHASRGGDVYSMAGEDAPRPAFTMGVDEAGLVTSVATGGPAGKVTRRGTAPATDLGYTGTGMISRRPDYEESETPGLWRKKS